MRAEDAASVSGRFLTPDPIPGGNANSYVYPDDPITEFDLNGMGCVKYAPKGSRGSGHAVCAQQGNTGPIFGSHTRGILEVGIFAAGVVGGIACGASVVCGVAVATAGGALSYTAGNAGTKNFSVGGLVKSAAFGGAMEGLGRWSLQMNQALRYDPRHRL